MPTSSCQRYSFHRYAGHRLLSTIYNQRCASLTTGPSRARVHGHAADHRAATGARSRRGAPARGRGLSYHGRRARGRRRTRAAGARVRAAPRSVRIRRRSRLFGRVVCREVVHQKGDRVLRPLLHQLLHARCKQRDHCRDKEGDVIKRVPSGGWGLHCCYGPDSGIHGDLQASSHPPLNRCAFHHIKASPTTQPLYTPVLSRYCRTGSCLGSSGAGAGSSAAGWARAGLAASSAGAGAAGASSSMG